MSLNYIIANINYQVTTKYEWKNLFTGDLILCPDLAFVNERSGYEIIHRSRQISERRKTCMDPPFVYTGPTEPRKFSNGKHYCNM